MTFVHYDICVIFSSIYESQKFSPNIILNDFIKSIQMLSQFRKCYSTVCLSNGMIINFITASKEKSNVIQKPLSYRQIHSMYAAHYGDIFEIIEKLNQNRVRIFYIKNIIHTVILAYILVSFLKSNNLAKKAF